MNTPEPHPRTRDVIAALAFAFRYNPHDDMNDPEALAAMQVAIGIRMEEALASVYPELAPTCGKLFRELAQDTAIPTVSVLVFGCLLGIAHAGLVRAAMGNIVQKACESTELQLNLYKFYPSFDPRCN